MKAYAVAHLPERFQQQPRSAALEAYISRKYGAYGYRKSRSIEYNREFTPEYAKRDKYRWVENVSDGLREVGAAHDIVRLGHTGWYNDNFQDETVHGVVYQLPARNGVTQYVPAVNDPCNGGCACIDFSSVTDDKEEAARWADHMAELWAEDSREAQAKDDAEQRIAEIDDEIKDLYKNFRRLSRELKKANLKNISVVRELIRNEWARTKAEIHDLRKERERIKDQGMEY